MIVDFDSAMLSLDENEGCLKNKIIKRKVSMPHSVSLIDIDGDCMADLFLTVVDPSTQKTYYELYIRREVSVSDEDLESDFYANSSSSSGISSSSGSLTMLKGMNAYCLVQRDELPMHMNNLVNFADADRDGMVDMIFVTKNDLSLHVFYNKLLQKQSNSNTA